MHNVFLVYVNRDHTEFRGPMVLEHVCATRQIAEEICNHDSLQGDITTITELPVVDSISDLLQSKKSAAKHSAMSKLTQEEKEALNLKD